MLLLKSIFDDHAFQSLGTKNFIKYLKANLTDKYPNIVADNEINEWIYEQGLPSYTPKPRSDAFVKVDSYSAKWLANEITLADIPTQKWTIHEWLHFINNLPLDLSIANMTRLDEAFNLTVSTNAEVAHAWYLLALRTGYDVVYPNMAKYLEGIGRRKLIVPLYKELAKSAEGKKWAQDVYKKARPGYHPLAQGTLDTILAK